MNISFFIMCPKGHGLIVDNVVVFGIDRHRFWKLSENERDFLVWYTNKTGEEGLLGLYVASSEKSHDMPQEEICKEFMNMIRAKNLPDPDLG